MAEVVFDHVTRIYPGNDKPPWMILNLDIKDGEFLVLVGPSGCGKSTTPSYARRPGRGQQGAASSSVARMSPTMQSKDRDIAMVFQNYALYPQYDRCR